jgi:hypothetical protein
MTVRIYGREKPDSPARLLREMEEVAESEDEPTNAEKALAFFADTHYKVALFSDRDMADIVYVNRRYE